MDSDYSVFSILPPYNTIEAQLIVGGLLIINSSSYTVTYEAVADPLVRIRHEPVCCACLPCSGHERLDRHCHRFEQGIG